MEPSDTAYLDIRRSGALGTRWQKFELTDDLTCLGRLECGEPGLNLPVDTISRKHGRILRERVGEETTYFLENTRGSAGIRLYELLLRPDDRQILRHGYTFQIPGVLATPAEAYFLITFCMDEKQTSCLSILFDQPPNVSIFGQLVDFPPQEYALLAYLYLHKDQLCPYRDIIAYVWTGYPHAEQKVQSYRDRLGDDQDEASEKKEQLYIVLCEVRRKIREASGGVVLIETIRGKGLCLRT